MKSPRIRIFLTPERRADRIAGQRERAVRAWSRTLWVQVDVERGPRCIWHCSLSIAQALLRSWPQCGSARTVMPAAGEEKPSSGGASPAAVLAAEARRPTEAPPLPE